MTQQTQTQSAPETTGTTQPPYLNPSQRRDVCAYLRAQAAAEPRAPIAAWLEVAAIELEAIQEASDL